jgi:hypothetical protein
MNLGLPPRQGMLKLYNGDGSTNIGEPLKNTSCGLSFVVGLVLNSVYRLSECCVYTRWGIFQCPAKVSCIFVVC